MNSEKGLSLIELMLSLTLSAVLMSFLLTIYLALERSTSYLNSLSTLEENAILASKLFEDAIETAGFIGCAHLSEGFPLTNHSSVLLTTTNKIAKNADALIVRRASLTGATLISDMRGYATLYTTDAVTYSAGQVVLLSDCKAADIFIIKEVTLLSDHTQKIISNEPLSRLYQRDAVLHPLEINRYEVKDTQRKSRSGQPIKALYLETIYQQSGELIEGVNAMQIELNTHDKAVTGASISLSLEAGPLQKTWYTYVALRN